MPRAVNRPDPPTRTIEPPWRALLVGDFRRNEFQDVYDWLRENVSLVAVESWTNAVSHLENSDEVFDWILLAQSRRGRFSAGQIDQLRSLAPLASLGAILGAWCEGETRSGRAWPGVARVYASHGPAGVAALLRQVRRGEFLSTSTEIERFLEPSRPFNRRSGLIAVAAPTFSDYDALAGAVQTHGYATAWLTATPAGIRGARAVLWDEFDYPNHPTNNETNPTQTTQAIQRIVRAMAPAPVLALVSFPRLHQQRLLLESGAKAVCAKPFLLGELLWTLDHIIDSTAEQFPQAA